GAGPLGDASGGGGGGAAAAALVPRVADVGGAAERQGNPGRPGRENQPAREAAAPLRPLIKWGTKDGDLNPMADGQVRQALAHLFRSSAPHTEANLTDAQFLERFAGANDEAAFEVLLRRHGPMVLGVCRRLLRHTQDAEDAFQATFLT